jgi:hypothetical protein
MQQAELSLISFEKSLNIYRNTQGHNPEDLNFIDCTLFCILVFN